MEKIRLVDVCNPKQWKTIPTGDLLKDGYPVYGANGIIGYYSEYNHEKPVVAITCRGATCGSINITVPKAYVTGNAMCLDDVRNDIEIDYLYYFLKHYDFNNVISGSAQPQITRQGLEKVYISYCSRDQQVQIVEKLKKVESIIGIRSEEIQKLDSLIKARFVEMFSGEKNMMKMSDICSIITDGTHQPPKFVTEGIPFIFVSNVVSNKITYDAEKFITQETYDELIKRTPIEIGDVLLSTVGSYGHPAVVKSDEKFLFQRHIAYLKPKKDIINSDYLHGALLSPDVQKQIEKGVKGIAQKTLNLSEIKKMTIPVPDLARQKQFADFEEQVDKSKVVVQKALDETQTLFDSLMQEYFG